ncbi:virginiamycin B lyase family protein [Rhabdothermincola salaria]|uniref:Vgb family protein n=1 Tax=Rhabdothermincola salaria TaxID=2903142 RepID=UPI001E3BEEC8|nr:hypothetical protein [Rhabdothermincola salaria]MCD9624069.1 hypothetical protein [Rhabdothermincola salaria]
MGDTRITDYALGYPTTDESMPSTHEITYDQRGGKTLWVTGMMHDSLVEIGLDGTATDFFPMPAGSTPHGVAFDADANLYVGLQYADGPDDRGQIARVDPQTGAVLETHAVGADPHGMSIGSDGATVWFTGKLSNVVGRVTARGEVSTWPLPTPEAMPIYITPGPDGDEHMWFTELTGNKIGRIAPDGSISEFAIPTPDSRPIAIVPDPRGDALWFSQEAGNKVARIDLDGTITEYPVPRSQSNVILGALTFASDGDLWIQQYVNQDPEIGPQGPGGDDHLVRLAADALTRDPDRLQDGDFTFYAVPTEKSVLHRIIEGPDGGIWFTELATDKIGRLQPD